MPSNPLAPSHLDAGSDANNLLPELWSAQISRTCGEISISGKTVSEIGEQFGTPLFVVDETHARARAASVRESFEEAFNRIGTTSKVYYASKAFLTVDIAKWMIREGLYLDVASGGELAVALAAGVDARRVGFHGNNKSLKEIERAVELGLGAIVLDSIQEIERVAAVAQRVGKRQRVRLRVNSGVHASTHAFLATAHEDQKFGITLDDAFSAVEKIRSHPNLKFIGLHCHIGSQIFGTDGFAESAKRLLEAHAELLAGGPIPELNLGGGFGIAYTSADQPTPIEEIAAGLAEIVASECARLNIPVPVVAVEPGRSIIGTSTFTLYTVGTTKDVEVDVELPSGGTESAVRKYVSVDGGMSDNIRTALYGATYTARIANRVSDAEPALARVVGKHCESGDIVVDAEYLPGDIRPGDLLAVPVTGAYCWSLANNYNYVPRPPVVAVRDGVARLLVRGETEDDLLVRDMGVIRKGLQ